MSVDSMNNVRDPFAETPELDDPFATTEDVRGGGGTFVPTPSLEALDGRLVAMIPRKFEDDAPVPEQFAKTPGEVRDRYTVDLFVLNGGELRYWYNAKQEGSDERIPTEHVIPASEIPAAYTDIWRVEQAVIGQLRKVDGSRRPILLGVVRRGPKAKDRGKKDYAAVGAEWSAYVARGQKGTKPEFSWQIDTEIAPELRALAVTWWNANRGTITL